jgi:Mrp family chromosome partitioning ATPase
MNELTTSGPLDLVLYDTPLVLGLADAARITQRIDGLVLLVSIDRVDRAMPKEATPRIRILGTPLFGVVTNT